MRLDINLASQPYGDVQRFFFRWRVGLLLLAVLTVGLLFAAGTAFRSWRTTEERELYLRQQIADREGQKLAVEAFLNRPENRQTRNRSQFLNALFARKAFSWTEVFSDMETLVPARLHVVSITPKIDENNELELDLKVAGSSRDSAIELVRRLEQSPHFSAPRIKSEATSQASNQPPSVEFDIAAIYVPAFARPQKAQEAPMAHATANQPRPSPEQTAAKTEAHNGGH